MDRDNPRGLRMQRDAECEMLYKMLQGCRVRLVYCKAERWISRLVGSGYAGDVDGGRNARWPNQAFLARLDSDSRIFFSLTCR